jgi:phosphoribosylaminoimidazole-succinocarboxamide synthase
MIHNQPLSQIELSGIPKLKSGKVREVFDLGDTFLFVASDRLSAFDVILPDPIPGKGHVLTAMSAFWFAKTAHIIPNHAVTTEFDQILERKPVLEPHRVALDGRSMLVRKCSPLPVECVVRGYLAGSGLKDYKKTGAVCGHRLPSGLVEGSELPKPIFTPSTKAEAGHDENIDFARTIEMVGQPVADKIRDVSIAIYEFARAYARQRGIIIADTKFEFGMDGDKLILIDEALTPDSSRFWPVATYQPGKQQPSFDKQFVRDYLETLTWNKTPPGPRLPADIIAKTSAKYIEALERLTRSPS